MVPGGQPIGTYVYLNENSNSQVSVPLFVHFRFVDLFVPGAKSSPSPSPNGGNTNGNASSRDTGPRISLYGSVGYSASLRQGTLFGLSLGLDNTAFLTVAIHSQTINILCPNVNANTGLVYMPGSTTPAVAGSGAPTLCATRTAKPSIGLTLPIDTFTTFIGNLSKLGQ